MEKHNWISVKTKNGLVVNVRQSEPFSDSFIDENGNTYKIDQIDMRGEYISLKKTIAKDVEHGLDGYRAIYG